MVSFKLLLELFMCYFLVKRNCLCLLKGRDHILYLCHLTWHLGRTLAAVDMSCMLPVGRSESLQKRFWPPEDSSDILFGVFLLCAFQIFWGGPEYNKKPAPHWDNHWSRDWGVFVSLVQISVQYHHPSHPTGTSKIQLVSRNHQSTGGVKSWLWASAKKYLDLDLHLIF